MIVEDKRSQYSKFDFMPGGVYVNKDGCARLLVEIEIGCYSMINILTGTNATGRVGTEAMKVHIAKGEYTYVPNAVLILQ